LKNDQCLICGQSKIHDLFTAKDHGISQENFIISECQNCKFQFTKNPPEEFNIGPYYEATKYISHTEDSPSLINKLYFYIRDFMFVKKYEIIRKYNSSNNFLDIGCGLAHFLNFVKSKNNNVTGIEKIESTAAIARSKFQIEILSPDFLLENKLKDKYDVITMWHVLEHLYNPNEYINAIKKLLNHHSILVIAIPNQSSADAEKYGAFWAGYDVPRHLWHFNPTNITSWVEQFGFKHIATHRLPFDAFYVSILSEKYQGRKFAVLRGMFCGLFSYLKSLSNIQKTSSLIYVFKLNPNE
jgi:2-polyprenyl-3-methyl-5-hydroxy-6-metoxy-1,4-benzoquinol methylase